MSSFGPYLLFAEIDIKVYVSGIFLCPVPTSIIIMLIMINSRIIGTL